MGSDASPLPWFRPAASGSTSPALALASAVPMLGNSSDVDRLILISRCQIAFSRQTRHACCCTRVAPLLCSGQVTQQEQTPLLLAALKLSCTGFRAAGTAPVYFAARPKAVSGLAPVYIGAHLHFEPICPFERLGGLLHLRATECSQQPDLAVKFCSHAQQEQMRSAALFSRHRPHSPGAAAGRCNQTVANTSHEPTQRGCCRFPCPMSAA